MVDTIRLFTKISLKDLRMEKWKKFIDKETGVIESYYDYIGKVRIAFYPDTKSLSLSGRYISSETKDRTKNFDDMFSTQQELKDFFIKFEKKVNNYFKSPKVNILKDKITRIDYTFNLETKYVNKYVEFFNLYFERKKDIKFKNYSNHVTESSLDFEGSFYMKTEKQYNENKNQNFTINFYNKQNQLQSTAINELATKFNTNITDEDILSAENILRLEIQLHHQKLKTVCLRNNIDWQTRSLSDLFDINIAQEAISHEIKRFFTDADFYSYQKAKDIIISKISNRRSRKSALEYIEAVSKNNKVKSYTIERKLIEIGVFPYYFLPKQWNIDILENPIKLIDKKITDNNLQNLTLKEI